jgi:hypothetical protein
MDPNKKLERKISTETTGIDSNTEFDAVVQLNVIPKTRHITETSKADIGPLDAISIRWTLDAGNDLRGVMAL